MTSSSPAKPPASLTNPRFSLLTLLRSTTRHLRPQHLPYLCRLHTLVLRLLQELDTRPSVPIHMEQVLVLRFVNSHGRQ